MTTMSVFIYSILCVMWYLSIFVWPVYSHKWLLPLQWPQILLMIFITWWCRGYLAVCSVYWWGWGSNILCYHSVAITWGKLSFVPMPLQWEEVMMCCPAVHSLNGRRWYDTILTIVLYRYSYVHLCADEVSKYRVMIYTDTARWSMMTIRVSWWWCDTFGDYLLTMIKLLVMVEEVIYYRYISDDDCVSRCIDISTLFPGSDSWASLFSLWLSVSLVCRLLPVLFSALMTDIPDDNSQSVLTCLGWYMLTLHLLSNAVLMTMMRYCCCVLLIHYLLLCPFIVLLFDILICYCWWHYCYIHYCGETLIHSYGHCAIYSAVIHSLLIPLSLLLPMLYIVILLIFLDLDTLWYWYCQSLFVMKSQWYCWLLHCDITLL